MIFLILFFVIERAGLKDLNRSWLIFSGHILSNISHHFEHAGAAPCPRSLDAYGGVAPHWTSTKDTCRTLPTTILNLTINSRTQSLCNCRNKLLQTLRAIRGVVGHTTYLWQSHCATFSPHPTSYHDLSHFEAKLTSGRRSI
jgi:hypothetical protein